MDNTKYSTIQMNDVENLVDALISAPRNKLMIMTVMAETFISGMRAQERLMATNQLNANKRNATEGAAK